MQWEGLKKSYQGLLFLGVLSFLTPSLSWAFILQSAPCQSFAEFNRSVHALSLKKQMSIKDFQLERKRQEALLNQAAPHIFQDFQKGVLDLQKVKTCFTNEAEFNRFSSIIEEEFLRSSFEWLVQSGVSSAKKLSEFYWRQGIQTRPVHLDLVSHFFQRAGIHRKTKGIVFRLDSISFDEWILTLIHELVHGIDPFLEKGVETFSQEAWVKEFVSYSRTVQNSDELPWLVRERLNQWLMAGLDRGFLGEVRAWSVTTQIYFDLLSLGRVSKVFWMEDLVGGFNQKEEIAVQIFRKLDPDFSDPVDGIFSNPLIQNSLQKLRLELRSHPERVQFGVLKAFF